MIWQTMETAPKDRPILVWTLHDADPYAEDNGRRLTPYGYHCEGSSYVTDGMYVVEWRDGYYEPGDYPNEGFQEPGAWWLCGCDDDYVANPVLWCDVPLPSVQALARAAKATGSMRRVK